MLSEKRHEIILNLLKLKGFVSLTELLEATESSESTIRRDLSYLESINLLKRVHGGAKSLANVSKELSYNEHSRKKSYSKICSFFNRRWRLYFCRCRHYNI